MVAVRVVGLCSQRLSGNLLVFTECTKPCRHAENGILASILCMLVAVGGCVEIEPALFILVVLLEQLRKPVDTSTSLLPVEGFGMWGVICCVSFCRLWFFPAYVFSGFTLPFFTE